MGLFILQWLAWAVIGAIIGGVGSRVIHRHLPLINSIIIGILGAFVGGFLASQFRVSGAIEFDPWSLIAAGVGAVVLLLVVRQFNRARVVTGSPVEADRATERLNRREEPYSAVTDLGRRQIPTVALIALTLAFPFLDALIWAVRIPSITVVPPPFGTVGTYRSDQGQLDYLLYTPTGYQEGTEVPLLLFLHGCASDPVTLENISGMRALADANNFMVIYPQQNFISSPHRCWNWYDTKNHVRDSGEPSLLVGIVNQVQAEYSVDAARRYMAGFSSGGAMTSLTASCYRDVFAAAAIHSGLAYEVAKNYVEGVMSVTTGTQTPTEEAGRNAYDCSTPNQRPLPVMILHGTVDNTVFPINADHTLGQMAQTNDLADDGDDNDSLNTTPTSTEERQAEVEGGHTYTVEEYRSGDDLLIQRYIVDGLSHMWSGGTRIFPMSDPLAPDATQLVWDFVSAYQLAP